MPFVKGTTVIVDGGTTPFPDLTTGGWSRWTITSRPAG